jgi:hypothetical protein
MLFFYGIKEFRKIKARNKFELEMKKAPSKEFLINLYRTWDKESHIEEYKYLEGVEKGTCKLIDGTFPFEFCVRAKYVDFHMNNPGVRKSRYDFAKKDFVEVN